MRLPCLLLSFALLLPLMAAAQQPVRAVPQLDISRYAGQWHEIAHLPVSFQKKCRSDITASYTLRDDGLIGVRNGCRSADGELTQAEGVARPVEGRPGQLQVRFAPEWLSWLPLVWADYWVIALDPDYQWAVVGEPDRKYLWILSRSPQMPGAQLEQLKRQATQMGYDLSPLIVAAPLR
jgi:apolipoprotein D and lipocalin family protein